MAQLRVRGLDDAVVVRLKERARRNGRSLEAELRLILRQAAGMFPTDVMADVERARALFKGRTFSDSSELIREDRER
jgi:plasmid stability protein